MKKAMLFAVALGFLSAPAFAQQTPGGQSSGGPARMGIPGEVQPTMSKRRMMKSRMMKRKMMRRKAMRRRM